MTPGYLGLNYLPQPQLTIPPYSFTTPQFDANIPAFGFNNNLWGNYPPNGYNNFIPTFSTNSTTPTTPEIDNYSKTILETINKNNAENKKTQMEAPLTKDQLITVQNTILDKAGSDAHKVTAGGLATTAAMTGIFATPEAIKAIGTGEEVLNLFISKNPNLYKSNPDTMLKAYSATRKLDKKFIKDIKAAGNDTNLVNTIMQERNRMINRISTEIQNGNAVAIENLSNEFETAARVKNGKRARNKRIKQGKIAIESREAAVNTAKNANKIKTVTSVKEGTSFLRNLGGKSTFVGLGIMLGISGLLESKKIKEAYSIDKEAGNKQLAQSAISSVLTLGAFTLGDAAAKTIVKKQLPKIVGKIASKIATKGACKGLGAALGSIVPGIGTIAGLIIGTAADFAISHLVLPHIKLFKNDALTEAKVKQKDDKQLISDLAEIYSGSNADIGSAYGILQQYCPQDTLTQLDAMHKLTPKERKIKEKEAKNAEKAALKQQEELAKFQQKQTAIQAEKAAA